ncbi:MAG: cell division protein FtsQ/DivIB [Gaiellaceae bacterium]
MAARRTAEPRARAAVVPLPGRRRDLTRLLPSGRSLLAGFGLLALAAGCYGAARTTSLFAVTAVEVRGATPAVARNVRRALAPIAGESLLGLPAGEIEHRVTALPDVAAVTYDRAFPHTLVVVVTPERPVAVLRRGRESWLLSARARVIRPVARGARPRLPRVWIRTLVPVAAGGLLVDRNAARAVRALAPPGFPGRIRTVWADDRELTFQLVSGLEVRLGDETDLALKLAVASRIAPTLAAPANGGPTYLDVSVASRPVAGTTLKSEVEGES